MMWSYAQFPDETQVAYSDVRVDRTVRIDIERPRDWGFDFARCIMPAYQWSDVDGFTDQEIEELEPPLIRACRVPAREEVGGRLMPSLFAFGPYVIFFWTGEQGEPIRWRETFGEDSLRFYI